MDSRDPSIGTDYAKMNDSASSKDVSIEEARALRRQKIIEKQKELERIKNEVEKMSTTSSGAKNLKPIESQLKTQDLLDEVLGKIDKVAAPNVTPEESPRTSISRQAGDISVKHDGQQHHLSPSYDVPVAFKLQKASNVATSVSAKNLEKFDKSIQVDMSDLLEIPSNEQAADEEDEYEHRISAFEDNDGSRSQFPTKPLEASKGADKSDETKLGPVSSGGILSQEDEAEATPKEIKKLLTDEEKKSIVQSPEFLGFFMESTKLVERALGASEIMDIAADYSGTADDEQDSYNVEKLKFMGSYFDPQCSEGRPVTDVRASPTFNELFVASYGKSDNLSLSEPDGCVLVWNVTMTQRPEYSLTYQSAVCCTLFNKFHPNLIIGGTFTGGIVVWDTRARSKPVQRTPFSSKGHSHPVFAAEIVGTQHANNLVSLDTNGRLCQWSLSMLSTPAETVNLMHKQKEIACGCFAFSEEETNTLIGGSQDGFIFEAHIYGSRVGVTEVYESHSGMVTATDFHPHGGEYGDFTDLLLTSSLDWTVKLWSPKNSSSPLYTFENSEDYVYDVRWHPTHPAYFASANGDGQLLLWNLLYDWESPALAISTENVVNKLSWSSDGRRLIAGNLKGHLHLWNASNDVHQARSEDASLLAKKIEDIHQEP